jgi:uncharacterized membrane protein YgcG
LSSLVAKLFFVNMKQATMTIASIEVANLMSFVTRQCLISSSFSLSSCPLILRRPIDNEDCDSGVRFRCDADAMVRYNFFVECRASSQPFIKPGGALAQGRGDGANSTGDGVKARDSESFAWGGAEAGGGGRKEEGADGGASGTGTRRGEAVGLCI